MITGSRSVRVLAYDEPVDMRKSFDGLAAIVREKIGEDPLSGELYLFVSRNRKRAKVLLWDGTGLCVYAKRLEQGRFSAPWSCGAEGPLQLTTSELQLLLEGMELRGRLPLSPPLYTVHIQRTHL
ncbi:MAG: IS66 family insertion sequence element accessory protein TnpB [Thermoanaerobaculia bacterium]